ncbi:hypothetical protein [Roseivivax isoporae]|uniref:Uncharacterized protein n=1 Tax=Roseivivax isoporae LMG 25204 TaxID=1449351 RepID=X7F684_9RHOB|nr:hypothetical protein [Roseivivax isoporae]ETX28325.1 hypothetical protein RISW2_08490 [Roseivivax isoporae LMG 25204]
MTQEQTPANVAREATVGARVNLRETVLLGVTGTEAAPSALLRLPGGKVAKVATGTRVGDRIVVAIDATRIALARGGRAEWIEIPGS